ncbi:alpha-2-macroglobulin family protein [Nevskia sp.]|uniref:alpha-2-macroglobulin family protein n=1 Tax=Nevskia sp. TaxID=1929292 RepID=UPI0025ECF61B|nr:alpha-2-macroglobulin family protein [Nevskia sp.]
MSARRLLAALALLASATVCADELKLLRITPDGVDVEPSSQQIVLSFDRSVVPLGRMERRAEEVPVTITPALPCDWRWLDPQNLACNLPEEAALTAATAYVVTVKPALESVDGAKLARGTTHRFVTARPSLRYATVDGWRGPTLPVIRAQFDQPVTAASLVAAARIAGKPVIVEPITDDYETPYYVPALHGMPAGEARPRWRILPAEPLPADRDGELTVGDGLVSALGPERGVGDGYGDARFHTFGDFKLLGIRCGGSNGELIAQKPNAEQCNPLYGPALVFSAPVTAAENGRRLAIAPDPKGGRKDYDPWANAWSGWYSSTDNRGRNGYALSMPFTLKAAEPYTVAGGADIRDVFGRALPAAFELRFRTAHRSADLSFSHAQAVLEAGVDSEVPTVVTNIDRLELDVTRTNAGGVSQLPLAKRPVAQAKDIAFAMPLDIRALLDGRSGVVEGWLRTVPAVRSYAKDRPGDALFAQVTPWQVHAKFGHYDTLVWVTAFATGKPVANAKVELFVAKPPSWAPQSASPAMASTDAAGMAVLPGAVEIDPKLEYSSWDAKAPLAVRVVKDGDIAVLPLTDHFSVDTYRASGYEVYAGRQQRHGHLKSWGTTAQGVYRAGDTVQYKLYVRNDASRKLSLPERGPYTLKVLDPADQVVHEREAVSLSDFGAIDGAFTVPKQGTVGWYRFELEATFSAADREDKDDPEARPETLYPMQVLVSDFTPAPFKLAAEIRASKVTPGQPFTAALRASLHAGGGFGGAPAVISARVEAQGFSSEDPAAEGFSFDADGGGNARGSRGIAEKRALTNLAGEFSAELLPPDSDIAYGKVIVEASVQDDRGRSIAATASAPYTGRDRYIGLKSTDWLLEQGKAASIATLVVDADGKPVSGAPRYVKIERREVKVAKVKDVGNAYVSRYSEKWVPIVVCKGRSTVAASACAFTPDAGGQYRITALVRDTKNRLHQSSTWKWASGKNRFLWEDADDFGLTLEADRKTYKVGDTARVLVKNPYPGATALITTERFGVIDKRTQVLEGSTPVIEVKITPDHLPGFYLSVVVQSPRVASPPPDGDVDLGKPAFRMGYKAISVNDPYKRIDVGVTSDRDRYRPRDTAKVSLVATPAGANSQPIELAVAVVDEAVYDLIRDGEAYFDPYQGFNRLDSLDLANYSLLTRLVGRQKFEKKGATPGGDGGADLSLRSVDKFVAYWNPSLKVDAGGRASFDFVLPDNLTAWKVLVLAVTPDDRFGLGSGKLIATKDTELRPVMPNQIVSGDTFRAGFSVLNRADKPRTLDVVIEARGAATAKQTQSITLAAFERKTVFVDVKGEVAANAPGEIAFTATAGDAKDRDALAFKLPVRARKPTVTAADFGFLDEGTYSQPIEVPAGSLPGGEIAVRFTPTVLGNLDGAFRYLRDYPYQCWEQRLTKGVMAAQYGRLKPWLDPAFAWPESAAIADALFNDAASFQAANGGMAFWDSDEAHVSPYLSAYTALAFEWLRDAGLTPPAAVQGKLDGYLDGLLKKDVGALNAEGNASLRSVVLAALARRGKVSVADLDRYAPSLPRMGLFGQAMYLDAARRVEGAEAQTRQALDLLLARGQQSAGTFVLRETEDRSWEPLLGSELRSNCVALSALVSATDGLIDDDASARELPAKLVRAITQARGGREHWENTQENVFCVSALEAYARRYESAVPAFTLEALLDGKPLAKAKFATVRDAPIAGSKPIVTEDIGRKQAIEISHAGQGRGYFAASVRYVQADDQAKAANAGFSLKRRYEVFRDKTWQPLESPMTIKRGELVRVELTINTPAARSFVVVDDPLPGGLEPVNPDLATASGLAAEDAEPPGSASPYPFYHRELRFEAARWFADTLSAGTYKLYWVGQAVATGAFAVPVPHVEAMYDPDIFGNDVPARLIVEESP